VVGDRYYLIDAGHGVMGQSRKAKLGPNYVRDFDGPLDMLAGIFLTHLHSDHVVDLNNILSEGLYKGFQSVKKTLIWGPGNRGQLPALFESGNPPTPVSPGNPTPGTREMTDLIVQAYATDFNDRLFDNRKPHPNLPWEAFDVPVPPS
jgi:ribonuclease BN (tRNA processing enzyme)